MLVLATLILLPFTGGGAIGTGNTLYPLYLLGVSYGYFAWPWKHGGQTLGMRAWGIILQRAGGGAPRWRDTAVRFTTAIASWVLLGLGFLCAAWDREGRTLHDRLSGTVLIRKIKGTE